MPRLNSILFGLAAALVASAAAAALSAQSKMDAGVGITVTPQEVSGETWTFDVVLVTHSGSLDDDLASEAVLIADGGPPRRASGWKGSAPGGHHRSGMLTFPGSKQVPAVIELRIQRPGEGSARVFRWQVR
jgi:hypothetical protein